MKLPITLPSLPKLPTLPSLAKLPELLAPLRMLPGMKAGPALKAGLADLTKAHRVFTPKSTTASGSELQEVAVVGANPGALRMLRFVPPNLPPHAPLVVVLHGCTQTGAVYDRGSGWSTLATRHGFALLYPEQQRSNNPNVCFNWFEPADTTRGQGEVASIQAMVAATVADLGCDPARVFVTGLSAGGAMTAALLATYPDTFTAGAIIAGLPYGAARSTQEALGAMFHPTPRPPAALAAAVQGASPVRRRPAVAIWHGTADTTVVPANATESVRQWVEVHGLREQDGVSGTVDGTAHTSWRDTAGKVCVESFMVSGMGHGTPIDPTATDGRGVGTPMPYMLAAPISSTWHIARNWGVLRPSTT